MRAGAGSADAVVSGVAARASARRRLLVAPRAQVPPVALPPRGRPPRGPSRRRPRDLHPRQPRRVRAGAAQAARVPALTPHPPSFQQVRALGALLNTPAVRALHLRRLAARNKTASAAVGAVRFDVFTLDFRSEASGAVGALLSQQAEMVNDAVAGVQRLYSRGA